MTSKSRALAALATVSALALFPATSQAGHDPALGAIVGGTFGAAIGHSAGGRDGAIIGGVLGALTGATIAAGSYHYGEPYYDTPPATYYRPARVRYATPYAYYPAVPRYYAPPVVYRPAPVYVTRHVTHRPVHAPVVVARPHGSRPVHNDRRNDGGRR